MKKTYFFLIAIFVFNGILLLSKNLDLFFIDKNVSLNMPNSMSANNFDSNISISNTEKLILYFFYSKGCPHCRAMEPFIDKLEKKYAELVVKKYEVSSKEGGKLIQELGQKLNADISGVPFTILGDQYFIGWTDEETSGKELETLVVKNIQEYKEGLGVITNESNQIKIETIAIDTQSLNNDSSSKEEINGLKDAKAKIGEKIKKSFFKNVNLNNLPLPLLTILVASIDGFNPCAMWVLVFLISILIGMKNKIRMWVLGSAFIFSSAVFYFLILVSWFQFFNFFKYLEFLRILIAEVALIGGGYYLSEYFYNKESSCKVTNGEKKQKIFAKLKKLTYEKNFFLSLVGVILLAFSVNFVELVCSAGLPAVYTKVLSLSNLAVYQYYLYILLYVMIFLLDDLVIFFTAMFTLKTTGLTGKYSRISHLVGGIVMMIIGLVLIFKPELLMLG